METTGNFVVIARNNAITKVKADIIADKNNQYVLRNTFNAGDLLILVRCFKPKKRCEHPF